MLPKIVIGTLLIVVLAALGTLGVMYHHGDLSLGSSEPAAQVAPSDGCGNQADVAPCCTMPPPPCNQAPAGDAK